jgi:energy-coupling factor transporter ATP-binding protein EcfA2
MALFQRLNEDRGITVVFVTHEPDVAAYTRRTLTIRDGQIVRDGPSPKRSEESVQWHEHLGHTDPQDHRNGASASDKQVLPADQQVVAGGSQPSGSEHGSGVFTATVREDQRDGSV